MNRLASLSVALPVHNGAKYLREALDSILSQTFSDFDVAISDNASTDETPDICREYARRDKRIKVSRSENFLQQADNVNRAVDLCSGEWIKLFCHDDLMLPDCLACVSRAIEEASPSVGLIANGESWLFMNGHVAPLSPLSPPYCRNGPTLLREHLSGKDGIYLPALTPATVRKIAWKQAGGFDSRFVHFDVFCWIKLLLDWDYVFVPSLITITRIHGGQVAVLAQRTLRSINDHRIFFAEFVSQHADQLHLSWRVRTRLQLKFLGVAGSEIASKALCAEFGAALGFFFRLPIQWWLLTPLFVARSYLAQKRRIKSIAGSVPPAMIFPR
jgi:hypothetical protein